MKYFFYIVVVLILVGFGYWLHPILNPVPAPTTVTDSTTVEPIVIQPDPLWVTAQVDSMVRDSLRRIIGSLPVYKDSVLDTATVYDTLPRYIHYAKTDTPQTLGYTDSSSGDFVKQGDLVAWYLFSPEDRFILDWRADPPDWKVINNTTYIYRDVERSLWDNRWINVGIGIAGTVLFYETARRFSN